MFRTVLLLVAVSSLASAQHVVAFASRDNVIELAVENVSSFALENVIVEAVNVPSWINFTSTRKVLGSLGGEEEKTAGFMFSVDKPAPVGAEQSLMFKASSPSGQIWSKEIKVVIAPPERIELFQNHPNPFNPTTAISYQLSTDSRVKLTVYDILGREVALLLDEGKTAGYHQEMWDASRYSSGMYVYELIAFSGEGKTVLRKSMLLLK